MTKRLHFHFSLSCIGEGNGSPLQCSCLENPRDGGAWWAAFYGVAQSRTRLKRLSSSSSSSWIHRVRKLLYETTALPTFLLWPHLLCFVQVVLLMPRDHEGQFWAHQKVKPLPKVGKRHLHSLSRTVISQTSVQFYSTIPHPEPTNKK